MGKKSQKKNHTPAKETTKKLSAQKRHELSQLIDALLKLGFKQTNNITEQWNQYVEIQSILERIRKVERNESCLKVRNTSSRNLIIDTFTKWAADNGALFDGIKISEFPGYDLGLEATRDFKKGELFVIVPRKLMMSEEAFSASISPIVAQIPIITQMDNVKLAFALLLEKLNPESFWKPYIDILPEKFSTVLYFSVNEMQELKGSNILGEALNQCKSIARQYAFVHKYVQNFRCDQSDKDPIGAKVFELLRDKFTYDLYRWAVSAVMTRQNEIPRMNLRNIADSASSEVTATLIPLWDMANHRQGEGTSAFNFVQDYLESTTQSDFAKGEQIFIYYGDRSNGEFLIHDGFIYPDNIQDNVNIKLGLSSSDELFIERCQLLEQLRIPKNCDLKVLPSPEFISPQLLAFVRIFNMNREQLNHWINSERAADLMHIDCALETSLESKTWFFLQTRLNLLLRVFPTTLEEDEKTLHNHVKGQTKLGFIRAMLLHYRILEKRILTNALDYVKQRIKA